MIRREPIPEQALHAHYQRQGAYLDCYATHVDGAVTHAQFIEAFYTSWLFRLERWILGWAVQKPSTDAQAREVACGLRTDFAAWTVEARDAGQLLMCDFLGATRSWFMVVPRAGGAGTTTKLHFGSVVTPSRNPRTGKLELGRTYRLLLSFHKLYSRALLAAARSRLRRQLPLKA
ncbi:MAG TPA: hypothetical protein VM146_15340 [Steroidobacteraceae bacterium]|nr:hypothetical protein [Steroidobacteraceae bacterium]